MKLHTCVHESSFFKFDWSWLLNLQNPFQAYCSTSISDIRVQTLAELHFIAHNESLPIGLPTRGINLPYRRGFPHTRSQQNLRATSCKITR